MYVAIYIPHVPFVCKCTKSSNIHIYTHAHTFHILSAFVYTVQACVYTCSTYSDAHGIIYVHTIDFVVAICNECYVLQYPHIRM